MRILRGSTAVVLAYLIAFGCMVSFFAAQNVSAKVPVINVNGIATKTLYLNPGTEGERQLFYPANEDLKKALLGLALPAARLLIDKNWDAFGDRFIQTALNIFEPLACNADGTSKYNVAIKEDWSLPEGYNFDRTLTFYYDWRLDPVEIAGRLREYIQYLKTQTDCEKVDLIPNSMGCNIVAAYLKVFGAADVRSVVMRSAAFQGVSLVGELFNENVDVGKDAAVGYLGAFLKDDITGRAISVMLSVFDAAGVLDTVVKGANGFVAKLKDRVYDEVLKGTFGMMPGIWALVPDEYYETAKDIMLDETAHGELIRKIDFYHYEVQSQIGAILKAGLQNGLRTAIIANYGLHGVPLTPNSGVQTDYLIDTKYASLGAVCANLNETLGNGYEQAVVCGHNHLSPDRVIDASTCVLPEYTWFVKYMIHTKYCDDYRNLVSWILNAESQPDVFTEPAYPQFMQLNKTKNTLEPVTAGLTDAARVIW